MYDIVKRCNVLGSPKMNRENGEAELFEYTVAKIIRKIKKTSAIHFRSSFKAE